MSDSQQFVVFYSNSCPHSKDFLVRLKQFDQSLFDNFVKICVDSNQSIPECIDSVPTIIVPTHSYPLTDNAVFMWLDTVAENYRKKENDTQFIHAQRQSNPQKEITNQGPQNTSPQVKDSNGIMPYVPGEMGTAYSDQFSFLDGNMGISHNFSFLDDKISAQSHSSGQLQQSAIPNSGSIDRPMMSKECRTDIDANYEKFVSCRDNDPYIAQAPKRCG